MWSVDRTEAGRVPSNASELRMLGDTRDAATGPILVTSAGGHRIGISIGMMSSVTSGRQNTRS